MYRTAFVLVLCVGSAFCQEVFQNRPLPQGAAQVVGDVGAFGPIGITTALAGPIETIAGAPYSAQSVTERVQVLADGNRIAQTVTSNVARDSQGRVRREESLPGLTSTEGDAPQIVMIDDPVAGVHWTLDPRTKIAIKLPLPPPPSRKTASWQDKPGSAAGPSNTRTVIAVAGAGAPGVAGIQTFSKTSIEPGANSVKTELGRQTIEGLQVQGTRIVNTIPAGQIGNEQPILITTETWYSPDLKVLVKTTSNDPRMGETTYRLTNVQRGEPAANLFQVPDDYTVKDQPGKNFVYFQK